MRLVEGLVVAGAVHAKALAADRVAGQEPLGDSRVMHRAANLAAHEFGRQRIGAQVEHDVVEGAEEDKATDAPAFLEPRLALLGTHGERRHHVRRVLAAEAGAHEARAGAKAGVVGLDAAFPSGIERSVVGRHDIGRCALEDREPARLRGDGRDHLHARRARADDAHALAREVHRFVRPVGRVQHPSREILQPGKVRRIRCRQRPRGHDHEPRREAQAVALRVAHRGLPAPARVVPGGLDEAGL